MDLNTLLGSALLVFLLTRLADLPLQVRKNDERARNESEDLRSWVADEDKWLEREVHAKFQDAVAAGVRRGGTRRPAEKRSRAW